MSKVRLIRGDCLDVLPLLPDASVDSIVTDALCRKPPSGRANGGRLHVDHDHETGRVRRLLCYHCNNALGHFRDDPDLMRRAADYIEEFR